MINKVILVGKIQEDATAKQTANDKLMTRVVVRTTDSYKKDGETKYDNEYHNCKIYGDWPIKTGLVEKLVKGVEVYVEGKLTTYQYVDAKTKQERYTTEIIIDTIRIV